jgi:hypothetical protein
MSSRASYRRRRGLGTEIVDAILRQSANVRDDRRETALTMHTILHSGHLPRLIQQSAAKGTAMTTDFDLTRYKALSFDCHGTLIDWEAGIAAVFGGLRWRLSILTV